MFKKSAFLALVDAYGDNQTALSLVASQMNSLGDYVSSVYRMEVNLPILRFRLEPKDFQEEVMALDRARRNFHEGAIAGVTILNRMAAMKGLPPIYEGSPDDRDEIADFCMETVTTLFSERTGKTHTLEEWVNACKEQ